ncbi:MAG: acetoacetate--CoA ligase [Anaerolineales bacterium]|nr:MAG: acetoacetate--CoA ligase [Anaerolineales bacterium]
MSVISEGTLLWEPSPAVQEKANLTHYMGWLKKERGLTFQSYHDLWGWSVTDLERFWESIWDFFGVRASTEYSSVLTKREMPGADWFAGAELNYTEHVFRNMSVERPALLYKSEDRALTEITWQELYDQTVAMAYALRQLGVKRGDRVVAYLPHIPETIVAFLACASLGAIWSSCSPDFGSPSVLDRFQQIEPKVLIAVDGYCWNGRIYDRRQVVAELQAALPAVEKTILVTLVTDGSQLKGLKDTMLWDEALDSAPSGGMLEFEQVPFNHPLWVLYSSGTTGLPKPIVQGQGGILLEHLKTVSLHLDLTPEDRFFWYTSTGWMMWNLLTGGLLVGSALILYNGSPSYPDMNVLWQLAEDTQMTYFGGSAAYISACIKAGIEPGGEYQLNRLRAVGSTGSPLSVEGFKWVYDNVHPDLALESVSGGTDLCTPFVGGCRILPVHAGEIQCRYLGAKVEAFNEAGQSVVDQVGDLVVAEPMPSMPLFFWNDPQDRRYRESYFEMFPGIWRHGDWIKINQRGGCVIYGRSDSTIKRHGVRMGTSEIYQAVEMIPEIVDSLVVDLETLGQESYMPLFVVLREGVTLDDALKARIGARIRQDISPRHVPDEIFAIEQIPRTLSGKKIEVPIRKILMGHPLEEAANLDAMSNPESIQFFVELAERIQKRSKRD